jgi:hypothetical protein
MNVSHRYAILVSLALCACNGTAAPPAISAAAPDRLSTSIARHPAPAHPDRRASWISPELARAKSPVLFVSDSGTADVYVYSLPALKVIGTVTGFSQPQGECSDNKGNVWVTDTRAQTIYELDHHGRLENELSDTTGYPAACAWDPTTGNMAVMDIFGINSSSGDVLIYTKGSQTGRFQNTKQFFYNFGSYDASGNLFFDGRDENGNFILSELSKGAKSPHTLSVSGGTIYFPGMVQWITTKHDLLIGDQSCGNVYVSCLYNVAVSKSAATITGKINLEDASGGSICDLIQGVKYGNAIAGSDYNFCGSSPSSTNLWPYPGGGSPTNQNAGTDLVPVGAAISNPKGALQPGRRARMDGGVAQQDLLYVSNTNGEVTVYRYWQHTLVGVLTDFTQPMGECADSSHNVYITDASAKQILEYAHGGTKPIKKFDDSPDSPYTCSVDLATGDLAVANYNGTSQPGNIAIWGGGSSKRTTYTDSALGYFIGCAYDASGNLLVTNGRGYSAPAGFAWLPNGGTRLVNIKIPGPGSSDNWYVTGIQWDGKYFVLDSGYAYRISLLHGQAYYVGYTSLDPTGGPYAIYDNTPGLQGTQIVVGISGRSYSSVNLYHYPAGGQPVAEITHAVDRPFGVVVSYKLKK